jgi:hypothetical protein
MGLNLQLRDRASVNKRLDLAFCRNAIESTKSSLGDGMRFLPIGMLCALLVAVCSAAVVHQTILYKSLIQKISGRIVGFGTVNPGVKIQVLDKPEVWSNDSQYVQIPMENSRFETFRRAPTRSNFPGKRDGTLCQSSSLLTQVDLLAVSVSK